MLARVCSADDGGRVPARVGHSERVREALGGGGGGDARPHRDGRLTLEDLHRTHSVRGRARDHERAEVQTELKFSKMKWHTRKKKYDRILFKLK